jgi:hypothetical protein
MAAAVLQYGRHVVMQHFVEHHGFDEKRWHPGLIEDGVNPNQARLGQVCTELQGTLAPLRSHALAPGDADVDHATEMAPRQVVPHRSKIVMTPFGA